MIIHVYVIFATSFMICTTYAQNTVAYLIIKLHCPTGSYYELGWHEHSDTDTEWEYISLSLFVNDKLFLRMRYSIVTLESCIIL